MKNSLRRFNITGNEESVAKLQEVLKGHGKELTRHDLYVILTTMKVADGFTEEDFQ